MNFYFRLYIHCTFLKYSKGEPWLRILPKLISHNIVCSYGFLKSFIFQIIKVIIKNSTWSPWRFSKKLQYQEFLSTFSHGGLQDLDLNPDPPCQTSNNSLCWQLKLFDHPPRLSCLFPQSPSHVIHQTQQNSAVFHCCFYHVQGKRLFHLPEYLGSDVISSCGNWPSCEDLAWRMYDLAVIKRM